MADDIERWSGELARDPASMVFIPLADTLRRRGQLDLALRVATRGLARHPYDGDAHDLLARIWIDRDDPQRAMDEWAMALRCAPGHPGALKGMGFAAFRAGRTAEAVEYLEQAAAADPGDRSIRVALDRVREAAATTAHAPEDRALASPPPGAVTDDEPAEAGHTGTGDAASTAGDAGIEGNGSDEDPSPAADRVLAGEDPRALFTDLLTEPELAALLLDVGGLVLAGHYVLADGRDVAQDVGGALTGVSDEARRAMRHLGLGAWSSLIFETDIAAMALAPLGAGEADQGTALVAAGRSVPLGLVRRLVRRVAARGAAWLAASDGAGP